MIQKMSNQAKSVYRKALPANNETAHPSLDYAEISQVSIEQCGVPLFDALSLCVEYSVEYNFY